VSVVTVRATLVATFVAVTVVPGRVAPVLSVTIPSMRPVLWAAAMLVKRANSRTKKTIRGIECDLVISPPALVQLNRDGTASKTNFFFLEVLRLYPY
jgi:hypothetical protein